MTGLFPFRSPLLRKSRLISFPSGTEMFQFPEFASLRLCIQRRMSLAGRVSPFRYLRINVCCRLPEAFRRLPRLSSPSTAKASTLCAYLLDHITPSRLFFYLSVATLSNITQPDVTFYFDISNTHSITTMQYTLHRFAS